MHSVKYYNAKFAHRVYKEADEYRSLSLVTLNANCNRKTARQDASAENALFDSICGNKRLVECVCWCIGSRAGLFPSV